MERYKLSQTNTQAELWFGKIRRPREILGVHIEGWGPKNWCFWTVWCWKRLLRVPWTARRSNQSILKEINPGISLEGMMLKLKLQYFGHVMQRVDSDAGRDWGQEEKGTTEDEMAGWHHGLDGHESEWTLWVGAGQGGLACCDSWGRKEPDTTERLNWMEIFYPFDANVYGYLFSFFLVSLTKA